MGLRELWHAQKREQHRTAERVLPGRRLSSDPADAKKGGNNAHHPRPCVPSAKPLTSAPDFTISPRSHHRCCRPLRHDRLH